MARKMQVVTKAVSGAARGKRMIDGQPCVSIAVIDDNASHLEFVAEALARPGLQIITSGSAEEGLALVAAHRPMVVFVDVIMPGLSGLHVLRLVKKFDPEIAVVLMSAKDLPQTGDNASHMAAAYLRKPIAATQLRACAAELIEKHMASHHHV